MSSHTYSTTTCRQLAFLIITAYFKMKICGLSGNCMKIKRVKKWAKKAVWLSNLHLSLRDSRCAYSKWTSSWIILSYLNLLLKLALHYHLMNTLWEYCMQKGLTSALMSLNLVMKACLTTSTATSEAITMTTSGNSTHKWSKIKHEKLISVNVQYNITYKKVSDSLMQLCVQLPGFHENCSMFRRQTMSRRI